MLCQHPTMAPGVLQIPRTWVHSRWSLETLSKLVNVIHICCREPSYSPILILQICSHSVTHSQKWSLHLGIISTSLFRTEDSLHYIWWIAESPQEPPKNLCKSWDPAAELLQGFSFDAHKICHKLQTWQRRQIATQNTILRTMSMQEAHKNSLKSRTDPTQMTGTLNLL